MNLAELQRLSGLFKGAQMEVMKAEVKAWRAVRNALTGIDMTCTPIEMVKKHQAEIDRLAKIEGDLGAELMKNGGTPWSL